MKKISLFTVFALFICFSLFVISCEEDAQKNDNENGSDNDTIGGDENLVDEDGAVIDDEQVVLAYPEETETSKKKGQTARNISFFDELGAEHKLAEWYKPNNSKKAKLIWLIFSTYDCSWCKVEKMDIPVLNGKYAKDGLQTILIMNGYLAGPKPDEEPKNVADLKETMISVEGGAADHMYGYLGWAHQTEFKKFINTGFPVNVFIDANSMEILDHFEGWAKEQEFVDDVDAFIESMLDML